jgi:hypothetical protein
MLVRFAARQEKDPTLARRNKNPFMSLNYCGSPTALPNPHHFALSAIKLSDKT